MVPGASPALTSGVEKPIEGLPPNRELPLKGALKGKPKDVQHKAVTLSLSIINQILLQTQITAVSTSGE
jgi:hypothetical protein